MDKKKKIMLGVAVFCIIGAALGLMWNFGVFESEPTPPPPLENTLSDTDRQQFEAEQERLRQQRERLDRVSPPSGS